MAAFKDYLAAIAKANGLTGGNARNQGVTWHFYPGMLQDSPAKWWADFGIRMTCHEGIDICFYRPAAAPVMPLVPGAAVPSMFDGCILSITKDLLGQSVIIDLETQRSDPAQPVMVYAHLKALAGLRAGDRVRAGQLIGHTADTRASGSRLLSHLHVSCILGAVGSDPGRLDWTLFTDRRRVLHLNPVFL